MPKTEIEKGLLIYNKKPVPQPHCPPCNIGRGVIIKTEVLGGLACSSTLKEQDMFHYMRPLFLLLNDRFALLNARVNNK
jgi:hypothetical protein